VHSNRFTTLLDANVLVPALARNILLSLADAELFRARWTARILDEMERGFLRDCERLGLDDGPARASRTRKHMTEWPGFADCVVENYEMLEPCMPASDPDDRHVIAAVVKTKASVIVTNNVRDFPSHELQLLEIEIKTADAFVADTIDLSPSRSLAALTKMRERLRDPPFSPSELIDKMICNGFDETAGLVQNHFERL
jgi:predicted nucleic acid-binding protein